MNNLWTAYIEIVSEHVTFYRRILHLDDLAEIGEFTRENISNWLNDRTSGKIPGDFDLGVYGWVDFHAVSDDIDIPWATEDARQTWERLMNKKK